MVVLVAHRNEHFMGLLRNFAQELKEKEPCMEKKRKKKASKYENKVSGKFISQFCPFFSDFLVEEK